MFLLYLATQTAVVWLCPLSFGSSNEIISASRITMPPRSVCTLQISICIYTNEFSTMTIVRHEFQWGVSCSHPSRRALFSPLNYFKTAHMKRGMGSLLMLSLRRKYGSLISSFQWKSSEQNCLVVDVSVELVAETAERPSL